VRVLLQLVCIARSGVRRLAIAVRRRRLALALLVQRTLCGSLLEVLKDRTRV
jgi:hypothetical protein